MKSKKVAITGASGYVGSWLTHSLADSENEVYALGRKEIENKNVSNIYLDITSSDSCRQVLDNLKPDVIIHLASHNDFFIDCYEQKALEVNTKGTLNLLESAKDLDLDHFIYFSTFHVYGLKNGHITEKTNPQPKNHYALTHYFSEKYLEMYYEQYRLPYSTLRLTNGFGAPLQIESTKWYLVLNDLAKQAVNHGEIVLKSNGKPVRDMIWLGDVCEVIMNLIHQKGDGELFNLSSGRSLSMKHLAEEVKNAWRTYSGKDINISFNLEDKNNYSSDLLVDNSKLKTYKLLSEAKFPFQGESIKIFKLLDSTT